MRGSVLSRQGRRVQHVIQMQFDVGMRGVACSANTAYLLPLAQSSHDLEHDHIYAALKCPLCDEKSENARKYLLCKIELFHGCDSHALQTWDAQLFSMCHCKAS